MGKVDQSVNSNQPGGINNQPQAAADLLDARQAAALLQVKPATLYAYVSRGLLQAVPSGAGERGHRYRREDLLRLRTRAAARAGHGPVAAGALRFGEPVMESAICQIAPERGMARGRSATLRA